MVKEKNVDFNVIANHLTMGGFDTQPLMALTPLPSVIRRYHIIAYLGSCSGQLRFEQFPMFQKVVQKWVNCWFPIPTRTITTKEMGVSWGIPCSWTNPAPSALSIGMRLAERQTDPRVQSCSAKLACGKQFLQQSHWHHLGMPQNPGCSWVKLACVLGL